MAVHPHISPKGRDGAHFPLSWLVILQGREAVIEKSRRSEDAYFPEILREQFIALSPDQQGICVIYQNTGTCGTINSDRKWRLRQNRIVEAKGLPKAQVYLFLAADVADRTSPADRGAVLGI